MDAVGDFVLLGNNHQAAEVADSHSPAFIQYQDREVLIEQHITRTRDGTQIRTRHVKSHQYSSLFPMEVKNRFGGPPRRISIVAVSVLRHKSHFDAKFLLGSRRLCCLYKIDASTAAYALSLCC